MLSLLVAAPCGTRGIKYVHILSLGLHPILNVALFSVEQGLIFNWSLILH